MRCELRSTEAAACMTDYQASVCVGGCVGVWAGPCGDAVGVCLSAAVGSASSGTAESVRWKQAHSVGTQSAVVDDSQCTAFLA